ncbi:MAG: tol-pal system protein YbgF [Siculibacillus sp.]|nr:tol-pal system protein YbgF [Siculibacillus sp.]
MADRTHANPWFGATVAGSPRTRFDRMLRFAAAMATAFVLLVGRGVAPAEAQGGFFGGSDSGDRRNAELSLRINQLENQMRGLNGQIEQMAHQIHQLQDAMGRMQKDYEFRLQELENAAGRGAKPPQKRSEAPPEGGAMATAGLATPEVAARSAAALPTATAPAAAPRGNPPAPLGQLSATDPIGNLIGAAPMNLGAPGTDGRAATAPPPASAPIPGVDPRWSSAQPPANARDEYDAAYGYVLNGEYELAEVSFKTFISNHPTDKRIGSAQFWLGESYYVRSKNKEAADAFLKSYTQFPDGPKAPDSLLKLGLSLAALGEKKAACTTYDELIVKYPKASKALRDRALAEKTRAKC